MAMIEIGFPVIVIAHSGAMQYKMAELMRALSKKQAEIIAISDVLELLELARVPLHMTKSLPEWLSPITAIIPGQLFALHLAHTRDFDVDSPRGLKKVTETH
jgi:glucosamine--fructose-6-phosphate aminotransferase (isomerizing)